jgi:hypothetical protein
MRTLVLFLIAFAIALSDERAYASELASKISKVVCYDVDPVREGFDVDELNAEIKNKNLRAFELPVEAGLALTDGNNFVEMKEKPGWKGSIAVFVETAKTGEGKRINVYALSYYGGFFRDIQGRKNYQLKESTAVMVEDLQKTLFHDSIFPERARRKANAPKVERQK